MTHSFDRIVIAVPDMSAAISEYAALFGSAPQMLKSTTETAVAWLALSNTVLELVEKPGSDARIAGLVLAADAGEPDSQKVPNSLGLSVSQCNGEKTASFREHNPEPELAVDHVVLRVNNTEGADACIALFRDTLGIRLALDKTVPQWGGRMLFFRAGKMTLEVIASDDSGGEAVVEGKAEDNAEDKVETEQSGFWGIAYKCPELASLHAQLCERGVELSEVREGRKPGTQVASLKSHCLGIPTLLLQHEVQHEVQPADG